jgi:hypothetical protein
MPAKTLRLTAATLRDRGVLSGGTSPRVPHFSESLERRRSASERLWLPYPI